jgi:hypothetical protein
MTATFVGIRNGRPRFDFGDGAPPAWLRDLLDGCTVDGVALRLRDGRLLQPGDTLQR